MSLAGNQFWSVDFWILNIEYLLLFSAGRRSAKIKTNIPISTRPNRWAAEDIRCLILLFKKQTLDQYYIFFWSHSMIKVCLVNKIFDIQTSFPSLKVYTYLKYLIFFIESFDNMYWLSLIRSVLNNATIVSKQAELKSSFKSFNKENK